MRIEYLETDYISLQPKVFRFRLVIVTILHHLPVAKLDLTPLILDQTLMH